MNEEKDDTIVQVIRAVWLFSAYTRIARLNSIRNWYRQQPTVRVDVRTHQITYSIFYFSLGCP